MIKKIVFKVIVLTMVLSIAYWYAEAKKGEAPPEGLKYSGSSITGTLLFVADDPNDPNTTMMSFAGYCKQHMPLGLIMPWDETIATLSLKENIKDFYVPNVVQLLPLECDPPEGALDLMVTHVGRFTYSANTVIAEIVFQYLVPSPAQGPN